MEKVCSPPKHTVWSFGTAKIANKFFLLIFSVGLPLFGFSQISINNFSAPGNADDWSTCDPGKTFTFDLQASDTAYTNVSITLTLANGLEYVASSMVPAGTGESGSSSNPTIDIADLPKGSIIPISVDITMDCTTRAFLEGSGDLDFDISVTGDTSATATLISTFSALPANGFNNSAYHPVVDIFNPVNEDFSDEVGDTYNRGFSFRQTGLSSELYEFDLCLTHGADLTISDQRIDGALIPAFTNTCVTINAGNAAAYNITLPLETNDTYVYTEDVTIDDCNNLTSSAVFSFGCNGATCESDNLPMTTTIDTNNPVWSNVSSTRTFGACLDDGATISATWELTGGKAYDLVIRAARHSTYTWIDPSSVRYRIGGVGAFTPVLSASFTNTSTESIAGICVPAADQYTDLRFALPAGSGSRGEYTPNTQFELEYVVKSCCTPGAGCGVQTSYILGGRSYLYSDNGCGTTSSRRTDRNGILMNSTTSDQVPPFIGNGDTEQWKYNLDNIPTLSDFGASGEACFDLDLGPQLAYQTGTARWYNSAGSDPNTIITSEEIITGTPTTGQSVHVCFDQYYGDGSQIVFDVQYNCIPALCATTTASTSMEIGYRFGDGAGGACADDCLTTFLCESATTTLEGGCCPAVTCSGVCNVSSTTQRSCFGDPDDDNDGVASGSSIDLNLVKEERALYGDEMSFSSVAIVNIDPLDGIDSFNFIYLELDFDSDHDLGSFQELRIYDASTTSYYSCTPNAFISGDNRNVSYYLQTSLIQGAGDIPADFVYEDGDSIWVEGTFVNLNNPGCITQQSIIDTDWYASLIADPTDVDKLNCCPNIPMDYVQVGYTFDLNQYQNAAYGCGGARFGFEVSFCIGGGSYQQNPFPYEIRNFYLPDESGLKIPPGLNLDLLILNRYRYTTVQGSGTNIYSQDITAYAQTSNGYIILDWDDIFNNVLNASPSNGAFDFRIYGDFDGSCNSESSVAEWYHESLQDYCAPTLVDETIRDDGMHSSSLNIIIPALEVTTTNGPSSPIEPTDEVAAWQLSLRETEGQPATNTWIVFNDPSGNFTINGVSRGATNYTATNNVWDIGTIPGNALRNFDLDVSYTGCEFDSLMVLVGWDCDAIPASDQQAIQGGLACGSDTIYLYIDAKSGALQQAIDIEPTAPVNRCETFEYELIVQNVKEVTLYELELELFIPYSLGLEVLAGSEICYPCDLGSPTYNYPIAPPSDTLYAPQGLKFVWKLDELVNEFDWNNGVNPTGMPGNLGSDANRSLKVKFDSQVNCDFIAGDFIRIKTKSHTYCGDLVKTITRTGETIEINGETSPYQSDVEINIDGEPINACASTTSFVIDGEIEFNGNTDGMDSLFIALPPMFSYSSVVFNPTHVTNQIPDILTFGPATNDPTTFQELRWEVNGGISTGTKIPYSITVNNDPQRVLCEEDNLIVVRTVRSVSSTCGGSSCGSLLETGRKEKVVDVKKDAFKIESVEASVDCGMTEIFIDNLVLRDTGIFDITEPIMVSFYYDADGSRDLTPGDVLIGDVTNTTTIPAGGTVSLSAGPFAISSTGSCEILAVASGCTCDESSEIVSKLSMENAGGDQTGCNSDLFNMGCGEDLSGSGFTYTWFGLNGASVDSLDDINDPNTTLSYTHFNSNDLTLEYVLLTTHPGGKCNNVDTVSITLAGVDIVDGGEIKVCPGEMGAFSGQTGFYDYAWSPSAGVTDPTDPNSTVVAPVGSQVYTLAYKSIDGCTLYYQETVTGVNCTDLELTKTVDQSTANIGDVISYRLQVVNQGPNGASYVEVTDTIPSQLTFLSTNPADGNFDPVTGVWMVPDILLPGDSVQRVIYAQIDNLGGPIFNVAEISSMKEGDLDSTPNNDDETEDDQEGVCTSVNVTLLCREEKTIGISDEFTSYIWFKDGVAIGGATFDSLTITEPGSYQVQVDGGLCPYGNCCPFIVTEEPCAGIGDLVWEDLDGDGLQDGTEAGIPNVKVVLYDASTGLAYDSTFTDADGNYTFDELDAGDYYLNFDITTTTSTNTYRPSDRAQGNGNNDSEPITSSNTTPTFTFDPTAGDDNSHDAGYVPFANVGDFVWIDDNQDGLQQVFEVGLQGASVSLHKVSDNSLVNTTTTDSSGAYLFTEVEADDYYLIFDYGTAVGTQSYIWTAASQGSGLNDSEANITTGQSLNFSFSPLSGNDLSHDAGVTAVAGIGDYVFLDATPDGLQTGETGVENVRVYLYDANTGTVIDSTLTNPSGGYNFADVPSGDYYIVVDPTSVPTSQEYVFASQDQGGDDNLDSDVSSSGQSSIFNFDATTGDDLSLDIGLIAVAKIGDYIWFDADTDGLQEFSESGIENVKVDLYNNGTGLIEQTTYTDANGIYEFADVPAGSYYIEFDLSTSTDGYPHIFTTQSAGSGSNDSEADPTNGQTAVFPFDPTTGDDLTHDAGAYPAASIGDYVWIDANQDGLQNSGESGIQNVTVNLRDANTNAIVNIQTTNPSGAYSFDDVPAGNYLSSLI